MNYRNELHFMQLQSNSITFSVIVMECHYFSKNYSLLSFQINRMQSLANVSQPRPAAFMLHLQLLFLSDSLESPVPHHPVRKKLLPEMQLLMHVNNAWE